MGYAMPGTSCGRCGPHSPNKDWLLFWHCTPRARCHPSETELVSAVQVLGCSLPYVLGPCHVPVPSRGRRCLILLRGAFGQTFLYVRTGFFSCCRIALDGRRLPFWRQGWGDSCRKAVLACLSTTPSACERSGSSRSGLRSGREALPHVTNLLPRARFCALLAFGLPGRLFLRAGTRRVASLGCVGHVARQVRAGCLHLHPSTAFPTSRGAAWWHVFALPAAWQACVWTVALRPHLYHPACALVFHVVLVPPGWACAFFSSSLLPSCHGCMQVWWWWHGHGHMHTRARDMAT